LYTTNVRHTLTLNSPLIALSPTPLSPTARGRPDAVGLGCSDSTGSVGVTTGTIFVAVLPLLLVVAVPLRVTENPVGVNALAVGRVGVGLGGGGGAGGALTLNPFAAQFALKPVSNHQIKGVL
jgi:hypothetical protein